MARKTPETDYSELSSKDIDPEKVLQGIADDAGITVDELKAEIEKRREQLIQDDANGIKHISFDEATRLKDLPIERAKHYDGCSSCKEWYRIMNPKKS